MSENSITDTIVDSVVNDENLDIVKKLAESSCDADLFKDIPFLNWAISLLKIKDSVREQWLLRKFCIFIKNICDNTASEEERIKAVNHFYKNDKNSKEELRYLMIVLDRFIEEDKAMLLALVYCEFVRGLVNINQLKIYAEAINRFLPGDSDILRNGEQEYENYSDVPGSMLRLASLGLMQKISKNMSSALNVKGVPLPKSVNIDSGSKATALTPYENGSIFKLTSEGFKLRSILFPGIQKGEGIIDVDQSQAMIMV